MTAFISLTIYIYIFPGGKFGSPYPGKAQQPQEQRYPLLSVCAVFSLCPNNGVAARVGDVYVHTDVDACDCRRGFLRTP